MDAEFAIIEQDPEGFCQNLDSATIQKYVDRANEIYYNSDDPEHIGLSDYAYDCLFYWLNKNNKKNVTALAKIGAPPRTKNACRLPYLMPSLDKVKLGKDLEDFLHGGSLKYKTHQEGGGRGEAPNIHWSLKLDGISALIIYENGSPVKCYLRGNGIIGNDISFILDHISLPKTTIYPNLVVRGELIVSKKFWNQSFGQTSKATARNWVAGILNSNFISPYLHYIEFVAYGANRRFASMPEASPPFLNIGEVFDTLCKEGFKVAKNGTLNSKFSTHLLMLYREETESYEYMIDGVVLSVGYELMIPGGGDVINNPRSTVAFKVNLHEQMRNTVITGIDWSITRYGHVVPVAEFKPVFIDGARIHRAFVYNAATAVNKLQLGVDTKVTITRSGGVIPTIVNVIEQVGTPILPNIAYPWHWSGCDILLDDPDNCPEVIIRRYTHFFETLEIPGIREGMIKRIREAGFTSLKQIVNASKEQLRTVPGIGPKKSEAFYNAIRNGIANAQLYRLMMASNTFPKGIGKTFIRLIVNAFDNPCKDIITLDMLTKLPGIGKVRANKIIEGINQFKTFIEEFNIQIQKKQNKIHPDITGKTFVLTGFTDDDSTEDFILDHGGFIATQVDEKTHALITNKPLAFSQKQITAFKRNIHILTTNELGWMDVGFAN